MGEESRHPSSWRLFRAHPALGLEETEGEWVWAPDSKDLDVAWLALPLREQRAREADFLRAMESATAGPDARFELEIAPEMSRDGAHGVWMDRWKAPALERELLDRVWTAAQERGAAASPEPRRGELDRTMRAHVLVGWDRYAYRAFIATMALAAVLSLHSWGDRSIGAVAVRLTVIVALVIVLRSLIERWYRRSQREPE